MSDSDKIQLAYISFSSDTFDVDKDVDDILSKARSFNKENDITGMLVFNAGVFFQLLEGPKSSVEPLYAKICRDRRHTAIRIIVDQPLSGERLFPEWTMGFRRVNEIDLKTINAILPWQELVKNGGTKTIPNEKILEMLKAFRYLTKES